MTVVRRVNVAVFVGEEAAVPPQRWCCWVFGAVLPEPECPGQQQDGAADDRREPPKTCH